MKYFLCAILFSCVLALVSAQLPPPGAEFCTDDTDCGEGQCCASIIPILGGRCQNLTIEGAKCEVIPKLSKPIFGSFIVGHCPCAEGLECAAVKKNKGICQIPPTTTTAPVTADDAADADADAAAE